MIATTPPYYAVIFSSRRNDADQDYAATAEAMVRLATLQAGFLGLESVRDADGSGITVSYWESEAAIANWRRNAEHTQARQLGRAQWYAALSVRVARVDRAYGTDLDPPA